MANQYVFLPWVRLGLARQIAEIDPLKDAPVAGNRPGVSVDVKLRADDAERKTISQKVNLLGPGDITGIDQSAIVKTEPVREGINFEPNFFPYIEFYEEDFPWRYTPAKPHNEKRLRPWLSLIVLEEGEFEKLPVKQGRSSRSIRVTADAVQHVLPDLEQSWAWAHVQVNEGNITETILSNTDSRNQSLTATLEQNPNAGSSRLLCPRKLKVNTGYFAFLVPAFDRGRVAGLGARIDQIEAIGRFKPSWQKADPSALELPIYHDWRFQTGEESFEALADKIVPRDLKGTSVGKLWMNAGDLNYGDLFDYKGSLNPSLPGFLPFEGALRLPTDVQAPTITLTQQGGPTEKQFVKNLASLVNLGVQTRQKTSAELPVSGMITDNLDDDPLLVPPIYGRWYAKPHGDAVVDPSNTSAWLEQLNLDPAFRVAAGLGADVVRENQEEYMSRAWNQLAENRKNLNQELQRLRFAQQVTTATYTKHFREENTPSGQTSTKLLALTQSVHAAILSDEQGISIAGKLTGFKTENAFVQPTYRRITRTKGPVMKKVKAKSVYKNVIMAGTKELTVIAFVFNPEPPFQNFNSIEKLIKVEPGRFTTFRIQIFNSSQGFRLQVPNWFSAPGISIDLSINAMQNLFKDLVEQILPRPLQVKLPAPKPEVLNDHILAKIIPSTSFKVLYKARIPEASPVAIAENDSISPNSFNPVYKDPTYEQLSKQRPELFIPNLNEVQPDSCILLEVNSAFIESFLVGMNHELAAEFLWRGYPADMNATFFRQFWDKSDGVPEGDESDIDYIRKWKPNNSLGKNGLKESKPNNIVFVIKAGLVKKYPNLVVYAQKAKLINGDKNRIPDPDKTALSPIFTGRMAPDYLFAGFELNKDNALGIPAADKGGYYFVIAERPGETHFGLDPGRESTNIQGWNDLSWQDLKNVGEYIDLNKDVPPDPIERGGMVWGKGQKPLTADPKAGTGDSAQMAAILIRKPVRIFIHASLMVS